MFVKYTQDVDKFLINTTYTFELIIPFQVI
jgi:hypothetical protein